MTQSQTFEKRETDPHQLPVRDGEADESSYYYDDSTGYEQYEEKDDDADEDSDQ